MEKEQIFVLSPVGFWIVTVNETKVLSIAYQQEKPVFPQHETPLLKEAKKQLEAYFDGSLTRFNLPLYTTAFPQFYQHVWNVVEKVPFGKTTYYSDIALKLGDIKKLRAVGQANAKNPFPIIIPCHRIIGKNNSLTGYVYGLEIKKWLLVHEGSLLFQYSLF